LSQKLIGETEMVSLGYSKIAYIILVPWLYGPLTASLIRDVHSSLSTACTRRLLKHTYTVGFVGEDSVVCIATTLRTGGSGNRIPLEAIFCAHVQTGHKSHSSSCLVGTGSLSCGSNHQGISLTTPTPHLVPRLKKE
jgi:hypothetical protein